jgi:hypothetical protein
MRILKYKQFANWAKGEKITDTVLKATVTELSNGLFDASLGGSVYKKRVSRGGQGKRGSYRTFIAFQQKKRVIFMIGFSKNEKDNITEHEKKALKRIAKDYLGITNLAIDKLIIAKEIMEIEI